MSNILETSFEHLTLSLLIAFYDRGDNPDALAALVYELSPLVASDPITAGGYYRTLTGFPSLPKNTTGSHPDHIRRQDSI